VQQLMTTKNSILNKGKEAWTLFYPILGDAFIFAPTNALWKKKRQATSHAFYKERMTDMLKTL
jgi:hypothetical protein